MTIDLFSVCKNLTTLALFEDLEKKKLNPQLAVYRGKWLVVSTGSTNGMKDVATNLFYRCLSFSGLVQRDKEEIERIVQATKRFSLERMSTEDLEMVFGSYQELCEIVCEKQSSELIKLNNQIYGAKSKIHHKLEKIDSLGRAIAEQEKEYNELQAGYKFEKENLEKKWNKKRENLILEMQALTAEKISIQERIEQLKKNHDIEVQKVMKQIEVLCPQLYLDYLKYTNYYDVLKTKIKERETDHTNLQDEIIELTEQRNELVFVINELLEQRTNALSMINKLQEQITLLEIRYTELLKKDRELVDQVNEKIPNPFDQVLSVYDDVHVPKTYRKCSM